MPTYFGSCCHLRGYSHHPLFSAIIYGMMLNVQTHCKQLLALLSGFPTVHKFLRVWTLSFIVNIFLVLSIQHEVESRYGNIKYFYKRS